MLDSLLSLDASILQWIGALPHPLWLTFLMNAVTTLGVGSAIWFVLALVVALRGDPDSALRVTLSLVVTAIAIGVILKPAVDRARPDPPSEAIEVWVPLNSPSFPSGHAAGAAAGAYALARVWVTRAPWVWSLAVVMTVSRLYLGAHYPLDVAVGFLVGLGCAVLVTGGRTASVRAREPEFGDLGGSTVAGPRS